VVNLYVLSTAAARGVTDSCRSEGRGYRVHIPEPGRVDAFMQIPLVELEVRIDLVGEKDVAVAFGSRWQRWKRSLRYQGTWV
jgi:hypothetical protein